MRPAVKHHKMDKATGIALIGVGISLVSIMAGIFTVWGANANRSEYPGKCCNAEAREQFGGDKSPASQHQKTDKKIIIAWISAAGGVLAALITAVALIWTTYLNGSAVHTPSAVPSPAPVPVPITSTPMPAPAPRSHHVALRMGHAMSIETVINVPRDRAATHACAIWKSCAL
jgi:hypothetical protein